MMPRRFAAFVLGVAVAGALTACAPTPLPAEEAAARYDAAMADTVGALEEAYPAVEWTADGQTRASTATGECRLHVGSRVGDPSLVAAAGSWEAVWKVVNPVLDEHGFAAIDAEDEVPGGWTASSSRDDRGAVLQLSDKGETRIILSVPLDAADCAAAQD